MRVGASDDRFQPYGGVAVLRDRTARRDLRVVAGLLVLVLLALAGCGAAPAAPVDVIQVFAPDDRKAAPELTGDLLDGAGAYDPASHAGDVLVVNFWASWCPPCVAESPELEAVHGAFKDSGVAVLGLNVHAEIDSARAFARQHTPSYPSIFDPSSRLALGFAVHPNAIPVTFVIDQQGRIAAVARSAVIAAELEPVVENLLAEAA